MTFFGAILAACLALFALYALLYFGWRTAAESEPAALQRAQYNFYVWLLIFVAASIGPLMLFVRGFTYRKSQQPRGRARNWLATPLHAAKDGSTADPDASRETGNPYQSPLS
jgi:hypothetical protein